MKDKSLKILSAITIALGMLGTNLYAQGTDSRIGSIARERQEKAASVAAPIAAVAQSSLRAERPEASMIEATVKPSGILCSRIATNTSKPTRKFTRNAAAIDTPSQKV